MRLQSKRGARSSNGPNSREIRSLLKACRTGDLRQVKKLLAGRCDPNAHGETLGARPLHFASECGHIRIAQALLEAGADINALEGFSGKDRPLEAASRAGHLKMVVFLLANRAEVNSNGVCPALTEAAMNNHTDVVKVLFEHGAKPETNLFSRAMWSCSPGLIQQLIKAGVKVRGNGRKEDRAIVSGAVRQASGAAVTELLAKQKADLISPINDDGDTPLHKAQHEATALFLINNGASTDAANRFGETPLHTCAKRGFTLACKRLMELGADPGAKTKRGFTPRMIARLCNNQETFYLLSSALHDRKPKRR